MFSYVAEASTGRFLLQSRLLFLFLCAAASGYLASHAAVARVTLHARALATAHYTCARELRITEDRVRR